MTGDDQRPIGSENGSEYMSIEFWHISIEFWHSRVCTAAVNTHVHIAHSIKFWHSRVWTAAGM